MADRYWVGGTASWHLASSWSATSGGAGGAGIPTSSDNAIINQAGTYTVTIGAAATCLSMTVSTGVVTLAFSGTTCVLSVYGDVTLAANTVFTSTASSVIEFVAASGNQNLTTNGAVIGTSVYSNGGSTVVLQGNATIRAPTASSRYYTLISGGLNLNGFLLTTDRFASAFTNTRSIDFNGGQITLAGTRATGTYSVWDTSTATGFSITGTPIINFTNSNGIVTSTVHQIATGPINEANSLSFNITVANASCRVNLFTAGNETYRNINFTGFTGALTTHLTGTIFGNLTFSTGMTVETASTNGTITFAGTSGTQIITSNGKSMQCSVIHDGAGGTVQLADAFSLQVSTTNRSLTLVNGTFDGNGKTISSGAGVTFSSTGTVTLKNITTAIAFILTSGTLTQGGNNTFGSVTLNNGTFDGGGFTTTGAFTVATGPVTIKNISTPSNLVHSSGTLTFGGNNACAVYSFTSGTLDLVSYQLTCTIVTASNTNARTIAFGTGNISCTGTGTVWTTSVITGLTITGTPVVNITSNGSTDITLQVGALPEASSISFNFLAGTYLLRFLQSTGDTARNVNFTGFAGTWNARGTAHTVYGSLTLSSSMTFAASLGVMTLGATSGTQAITSNGKTFDGPLTINGAGGTVRLEDAFTMAASRTLTLTNGTIDLNGKTLSNSSSIATGAGTKNITFNGGTIAISAASATAWNNANPTNFTTTAGTGIGKISMTAATAKTFVSGGSTYNCTLSNDGAGALTIAGSNTFTTIANGVQPTAFVFTAGTTQTVTNWSVSGTSGNLVTITSSSIGSPATLSKSIGTVSADYLSLRDSAATGGAAWYAGANSTNVSGNSGWIFTASPSTGNFFFMF